MTKNDLVAAATELNEVLGIEPAIVVTGTKLVLETGIKAAASLVDPAQDVLADATWLVLKEIAGLEKPLEAGATEGCACAPEGTPTPEPAPATAPAPAAAPEAGAAPAKVKKTKTGDPAAEQAKEERRKAKEDRRAAKESKAPRETKWSIIQEMTATKEGATMDELAAEIARRGVDTDQEKAKRTIKIMLGRLGFDTRKATMEANPKFQVANKKAAK